MTNKGFDLAIGFKNKTKGGLGYSFDLNLGKYKNEITKIDGISDFFYPNNNQGRIDNRLPQQININRIGSSISSFRGYQLDGKFNSQADLDALDMPGKTIGGLRFKDLNGEYLNISEFSISTKDLETIFFSINLLLISLNRFLYKSFW